MKPAPASLPPEKRRVTLAVIGAAHGVRGELRVKCFTEVPLALNAYGPLFADDGRVFTIAKLRPLKDDMLVVTFRGIADRDSASALTGTELFVDRERLPPPEEDEFYHADLIGLDVVDEAGEKLGTIGAVHDFGGGDFLEIRADAGGLCTIPFTKSAVPKVDIAARRVVIDAPQILKPEPGDEGER